MGHAQGDSEVGTRTPLRTEAVTTRLTRAERAVVEAAAVALGLSRSAAVRRLAVQGAHEALAELRDGDGPLRS